MVNDKVSENIQELLEEVTDEKLALEFIEEHGEKDFAEYYEQYETLVEEYGQWLVDAYVDDYGTNGIEYFEDAYQGEYDSSAEFAEQIVTDCGYINNDIPSWIEIDWQATWDNALSYDYTEIVNPDTNKVAIFSNNY